MGFRLVSSSTLLTNCQTPEHVVSITPGCGQLLFATNINGNDGLYIRAIIMTERGTNMIEAAETLQKRVS